MKNVHNKMRSVNKPYEVFIGSGPYEGWEWRVLRRYVSQPTEEDLENAMWLCAVRSPMTWGSWEYGDCYVKDIPGAVRGQDFTG